MSGLVNHTSIERLRGILKNRYGKSLMVNFMVDVASIDTTTQSPSVCEGDLRIPIFSRSGMFLAQATVPNVFNLSHNECESIGSLVSMVLEPVVQDWILKNHVHQDQTPDQDIIFINKINNELSSNVMFLESRNPHLIKKIADEIHQVSNRWACVSFEAIFSQIFTVHDIISLQNTTIVLNDILNTSETQRTIICEYLNLKHHQMSPLLLIGSSTSIQDLKNQKMIEPQLMTHLEKCIIEVERLPKQNPQLRETIELILEPASSI